MSGIRPPGSRLTPEELEPLALEHVERMFIELQAACGAVREQYHPGKLIKRHPWGAAGIAAVAVFMLVRHLRRKPAGTFEEKPAAAAPGLIDSFWSGLSGVVGAASRGCRRWWRPG
jgi:hypothetical protein